MKMYHCMLLGLSWKTAQGLVCSFAVGDSDSLHLSLCMHKEKYMDKSAKMVGVLNTFRSSTPGADINTSPSQNTLQSETSLGR